MAQYGLIDIKSLFQESGYSCERNPKNSLQYFLTKGDTTVCVKQLREWSIDAFHTKIKKIGVVAFIDAYIVAKPTGSGMSKPKVQSDSGLRNGTKVSSALQKRRDAKPVIGEKGVLAVGEFMSASDFADKERELADKVIATADLNNTITIESKLAGTSAEIINYDVTVPSAYKGYYFPKQTSAILHRVEIGRNCFLAGASGTGKTEFVDSLSKVLGQKLLRVNFSVGTTEQHLIGKFIVKNGETIWVDGVLPLAMKHGWWILFDELDYAMPEHLAVIQPVLEGNPLLITQNRNEEVIPHENFRIFATGNTKGRGDETQGYVGTGHLNLAFLDRWSIFEFEYTSKERLIVKKIVGDDVMSDQICQFFTLIRKAADEGQIINAVFSTRRLVQLSEAVEYGEALVDALEWEVFSRYERSEAEVLKEFAYDVWDREHYMKGWKLGDAHHVPEQPTAAPVALSAEDNGL